ncbi:phosphopantetheine adenylyltransferase [Reyranella sp. CPCC 100927]|uniref:phosphopantetheine adenylyltransferase n=1 Tax=Reyranella sp. CPCC 100927 TaxID=2599616 RepID=UPI0011B68F93|nr:phosphopantetheine adenylyltransferase [Reyranella sp. CPCC 100927]TWT01988.1 phosphopantetheine adenylyltransferase [Reyranella sp. CPCC 100927]
MSPLVMERLAQALLVIVGLVNLLPLLGVLGTARLHQLYGIDIAGDSLALLMRHRAVLLALVGAGLLWAAAQADVRLPLIVAAVASKLSFIILWRAHAPTTAQIDRVAWIDVAALVVLAIVVALRYATRAAR